MKFTAKITAILLAGALVAIAAQEYRYFEIRRDVVADRQAIFHSSSVFHVATLLTLSAGQELLPAVGMFAEASEGAGGHVVYAGKTFMSGSSPQVADEPWDAFILVQFDSQDAYAMASADSAYQNARGQFASSYAHGMQRSAAANLLVPVVLLAKRVGDRTYKLHSGITSEYGRYVKSLGEPRDGRGKAQYVENRRPTRACS